jgi:hypothetical protein
MSSSLPPPPVPPDADRDDQRETFVPFRDLAKKDHVLTTKSVKH